MESMHASTPDRPRSSQAAAAAAAAAVTTSGSLYEDDVAASPFSAAAAGPSLSTPCHSTASQEGLSMNRFIRSGLASSTPQSSVAGWKAETKSTASGTARAFGDVLIGRESMAVRIPSDALHRYMHMAPGEERDAQAKEQKLAASRRAARSRGVIHPLNKSYRLWWTMTMLAACITGWLVPFRLAFLAIGFRDINSEPYVILEVLLEAIFVTDILVSFHVGYYDRSGLLVLRQPQVLLHYLRHRFLLDFVTTVPFDAIALTIMRRPGYLTVEGRLAALLGILKMGRMYRVIILYNTLSYNLNYSLLALTMIRNFTFCVYLLHWAACAFWFIARQTGYADTTWVAAKTELIGDDGSAVVGAMVIRHYVYSLYWAIVTFATVGYGDVTPVGVAEVCFTIVYIMINLVVYAYILGTITLLVTKQDEEIGHFRDRMAALNTYCTANNLPTGLRQTMAGLLRLHMSLSNTSLADEQVLAVYPAAIRRKILHQLYAVPLSSCYLLQHCESKFLDVLIMGARVELYLPRVEIVSSLDDVNELYIIVAGHVEVLSTAADAASGIEASEQEEAAVTGTSLVSGTEQQQKPAASRSKLSLAASGVARALQGIIGNIGAHMNPTKGGWLRAKHSAGKVSRTWSSGTGLHTHSMISQHAAADAAADAAAVKMPVAAMRRLDTRSRPLTDTAQALLFSDSARAAAVGTATIANKHIGVSEELDSAEDDAGVMVLGPGDSFAEVAYFTEVPRTEVVRSLTVCRVLVIPRSFYHSVEREFPISARQVLENLKTRVEEIVANFLPEDLAEQILKDAGVSALRAFQSSAAAPEAPAAAPSAPSAPSAAAAAAPPAAGSFSKAVPVASQQHPTDACVLDLEEVETSEAAAGATAAAAAATATPTAAETAAVRPPVKSVSFGSTTDNSSSVRAATRDNSQSPFAAGAAADSSGAAAAGLGSTLRVASKKWHPDPSRGGLVAADAAAVVAGASNINSQQYAGPLSLSGLRQMTMTRSSSTAGRRFARTDTLVSESSPDASVPAAPVAVGEVRRLLHLQRRASQPPAADMLPVTEDESIHLSDQPGRVPVDVPAWASKDTHNQHDTASASTHAAAAAAAAAAATAEVEGQGGAGSKEELTLPKLALKFAGVKSADDALLSAAVSSGQLTEHQQQQLADLLRLRQLVSKAAAKMDQARLSAFLDAAARNEVQMLQDMINQGLQVDSADYDGRTALMIAAGRGNKDVVLTLLFAGANTSLRDSRGNDCMIDAAQGGHTEILEVLKLLGARTNASRATQAFLLCKATFEGQLGRVSDLLLAGCDANAQNYDRQSALHIAAAEGNLPAAKVLVQQGDADVSLRDRWGYSPLDFAHKVGDGPLVRFLADHATPEVAAAAAARAGRRSRGSAAGRRQVLRISSNSRRSRQAENLLEDSTTGSE